MQGSLSRLRPILYDAVVAYNMRVCVIIIARQLTDDASVLTPAHRAGASSWLPVLSVASPPAAGDGLFSGLPRTDRWGPRSIYHGQIRVNLPV